MKFIATLFLVLASNVQAETVFSGIIDLRNASNNATIPTTINAGVYSVTTTLESSKAEIANNIALSKSAYRDDSDYICAITGSFKVGVATTTIKSLTTNWQETKTSDVVISFGKTTNDSVCVVDSRVFEGAEDYKVIPNNLVVELPVKDARFSSVKLSVHPLANGIIANYELLKGDKENTLKALNPGSSFKTSLESSGNNRTAYSLSLAAAGYYHFDTESSVATKVK